MMTRFLSLLRLILLPLLQLSVCSVQCCQAHASIPEYLKERVVYIEGGRILPGETCSEAWSGRLPGKGATGLLLNDGVVLTAAHFLEDSAKQVTEKVGPICFLVHLHKRLAMQAHSAEVVTAGTFPSLSTPGEPYALRPIPGVDASFLRLLPGSLNINGCIPIHFELLQKNKKYWAITYLPTLVGNQIKLDSPLERPFHSDGVDQCDPGGTGICRGTVVEDWPGLSGAPVFEEGSNVLTGVYKGKEKGAGLVQSLAMLKDWITGNYCSPGADSEFALEPETATVPPPEDAQAGRPVKLLVALVGRNSAEPIHLAAKCLLMEVAQRLTKEKGIPAVFAEMVAKDVDSAGIGIAKDANTTHLLMGTTIRELSQTRVTWTVGRFVGGRLVEYRRMKSYDVLVPNDVDPSGGSVCPDKHLAKWAKESTDPYAVEDFANDFILKLGERFPEVVGPRRLALNCFTNELNEQKYPEEITGLHRNLAFRVGTSIQTNTLRLVDPLLKNGNRESWAKRCADADKASEATDNAISIIGWLSVWPADPAGKKRIWVKMHMDDAAQSERLKWTTPDSQSEETSKNHHDAEPEDVNNFCGYRPRDPEAKVFSANLRAYLHFWLKQGTVTPPQTWMCNQEVGGN